MGGCGLSGRGAPGWIMGPCIVEIDSIVIREVQYQFEENRRRKEEVIVKGNFGWVWSMLAERRRVVNPFLDSHLANISLSSYHKT